MKILVAGDYSPIGHINEMINSGEYEQIFSDVREINKDVDYSVVNFESTIADDSDEPIIKQGSNFHCSIKSIQAIKWAGFSLLTLANNHFRDYGDKGVRNSLDAIKLNKLDFVGGGVDIQQASKILYKEISGYTVAFINACEHEFSLATKEQSGSNPLDALHQYYQIKEAHDNADFVIVIVHGGHEYFPLPSMRMQKIYRFFADVGADVIINHHQHCYSGYEIYNGKPIFYGLGNFCFEGEGDVYPCWTKGFVVILNFEKGKITFELKPYIQCENNARVQFLSDRRKFDESIKELNDIIVNEESLRRSVQSYYEKQKYYILQTFEPYSTRLGTKLYRMHLLPSFVFRRGKVLKLFNFISCEAHLDKVIYCLKSIISKKCDQ
jgi:hypothetical protein